VSTFEEARTAVTCATCPARSAGVISFIDAKTHRHQDFAACVACATDALLNSVRLVTWTAYPSGASVSRGMGAAS
jgi:hypothetical protein